MTQIPLPTSLGPYVEGLVEGSKWPSSTVAYAFAPGGDATDKAQFLGGSDETSAWALSEQAAVRETFGHISDFLSLTFVEVTDAAPYNIYFQKVERVPGDWAGYAYYPDALLPATIVLGARWISTTEDNNNVVVHEIGHTLGLKHPHSSPDAFPGVAVAFSPGDFGLNTVLFSIMSYRDASYPLDPDLVFTAPQPVFMAFDIAALQSIYGANTTHANGIDSYAIPDALMCIWDSGGDDTIDFSQTQRNSIIDLRAASLLAAEGGGGYLSYVKDTFGGTSYVLGGYTIAHGVEIENAKGGGGHDQITGNALTNHLEGAFGNDTMLGADGDDLIEGGGGHDFIGGGAGNDTVRGGDGADTVYAGLGNDNVGGGAGNDVIFGSAGANVIYAGFGNDTVQGGSGSDTIFGSAGVNQLFGNDGNDVVYTSAAGDLAAGGAGNDSIFGADGADTIYAGLGDDFIGGGAGNDAIFAGAGANRIYGGVGNDTITAGVGKDVVTGGPGADVFVFASAAVIGIGAARDVITDFTPGVDDIDLRALGTTFNGTAGLLGGGAESFFHFAAGGLLIGDQTGDGAADWVLELSGAPSITAVDFLL